MKRKREEKKNHRKNRSANRKSDENEITFKNPTKIGSETTSLPLPIGLGFFYTKSNALIRFFLKGNGMTDAKWARAESFISSF